MGAGNCSTAGPVLLYQFAKPRLGQPPCSMAGFLVNALRPPIRHSRRRSQAGPCRSQSRGRSGGSLRGIGLVSGSPRWQNLARHFPAGRALVSDKTRLNSEPRRDPHDLLHRGAAAGAGNSTSFSGKVRHNTPSTLVLSPFASIHHQSNGFPLREVTFAHTISHADQALLARPQV